MKILTAYPPNYDLIVAALGPQPEALFCYDNTLYNPSGKTVTPDVEVHEGVHARQQGQNPDAWYAAYLQDRAFRLDQEIEAYSSQYAFAREHVKEPKLLEWALENMAFALSGEEYGNLCTFGWAKSKIRNYVDPDVQKLS